MLDGRKVQDLDLRNVSSRRRNPIIADIFNRLKYMDRRDSGFKKILDSYEFQEHYTEEMKPEFRSSNSEFWLLLKNLNCKINKVGNDLSAQIANSKMPIKNADRDKAAVREDTSILIRTIRMFLQRYLYAFRGERT